MLFAVEGVQCKIRQLPEALSLFIQLQMEIVTSEF